MDSSKKAYGMLISFTMRLHSLPFDLQGAFMHMYTVERFSWFWEWKICSFCLLSGWGSTHLCCYFGALSTAENQLFTLRSISSCFNFIMKFCDSCTRIYFLLQVWDIFNYNFFKYIFDPLLSCYAHCPNPPAGKEKTSMTMQHAKAGKFIADSSQGPRCNQRSGAKSGSPEPQFPRTFIGCWISNISSG